MGYKFDDSILEDGITKEEIEELLKDNYVSITSNDELIAIVTKTCYKDYEEIMGENIKLAAIKYVLSYASCGTLRSGLDCIKEEEEIADDKEVAREVGFQLNERMLKEFKKKNKKKNKS